MKHISVKIVATSALCAGVLTFASCNSDSNDDSKAPSAPATAPAAAAPSSAPGEAASQGMTRVAVVPGEAGGVVEDTFTITTKVTAIDPATRKITLAAEDGSSATFTAGPEVRNFDQLKVGDDVKATLTERLVVFVRSGSEDPSITHAAVLAAAPKGAKPGATLAESYEITAKVTAIDSTNRTADLQFSDGKTRVVHVRKDVDLSRYKVGDNVVIRVTEALSVLVK